MWIAIVTVAVVLLGVGLFVYLRKRKQGEGDSEALSPLPVGEREGVSVFQAWGNDIPGWTAEEAIAEHDLYIHVPEAFGVFWEGRSGFTAPCLAGVLNPGTLQAGHATRGRLRALNPKIKLFVQIGYTEGSDATTDFPIDHPWWLRVGGVRQPGWGDSYLFNLDLPEVRQHCANCCKVVWDTGVWDGIMLDVFSDDANHVDILRRIRAKVGEAALVIVNGRERDRSDNALICPSLAPHVNGFYMECGSIDTVARWVTVQDALDYNERRVRQPAINCLEISGSRGALPRMRATTCLGLTRSNGYVLYSDTGQGYASTHQHPWYPFWDVDLGKAIGSFTAAGTLGSRREFEHGTVVFNPVGGNQIQLTFAEERTDAATGERKLVHRLMPGDGGIYLV